MTDASEIGRHTVALLLAIVSIWLVHKALDYFLGVDAKFYDRLPVRYVVDTGHLAVLGRFILQLIIEIWRKS